MWMITYQVVISGCIRLSVRLSKGIGGKECSKMWNIGVIRKSLSMYVARNQKDWDKFISLIVSFLRIVLQCAKH